MIPRIVYLIISCVLYGTILAGAISSAHAVQGSPAKDSLFVTDHSSYSLSLPQDPQIQLGVRQPLVLPEVSTFGKIKRSSYIAWEKFRLGKTFKPYFSIGIDIPRMVYVKDSSVADFTSEITRFNNMRVGMGFRLHRYFGMEIYYNDIQRNLIFPGSLTPAELFIEEEAAALAGNGNEIPYMQGTSRYHSRYVSIVGNIYSPPIDLKYGSLEFTAGVGMAYYFGTNLSRSVQGLGAFTAPTSSEGVKLLATTGVILAFKKYASVKFGVDFVVVNDQKLNIPMFVVMSVSLNLHPF